MAVCAICGEETEAQHALICKSCDQNFDLSEEWAQCLMHIHETGCDKEAMKRARRA